MTVQRGGKLFKDKSVKKEPQERKGRGAKHRALRSFCRTERGEKGRKDILMKIMKKFVQNH